MSILWAYLTLHMVIAFALLILSKSRGVVDDMIFGLLWPYFVWRHIWRGY